MATKIINGKIVRDETAPPVGSPVMRRRSSLQELQLKEFQEQKAKEEAEQQQTQQQQQQTIDTQSPTWKQIASQSIRVFGMKMNILVLLGLSIISVVGAGVMGLLCSLLAVYLGTLFTTQNIASSSSATPSTTAVPSSSSSSSSSVSSPLASVSDPATPTIAKQSPMITKTATPPINAAQEILLRSRRNSITITTGGNISPRSSPLSSPLNMRSPRFATLRSIAEVEKLPMLDTPAC